MAEANGTPCSNSLYYGYKVLGCKCKMDDCSDFPTIFIYILESSTTGKSSELSLESKYTMRRMKPYYYRLMIEPN